MKTVFILTEEGRDFSTEGLLLADADIRSIFGEEDELEFVMGPDLNDPETLANLLEENADRAYLMTSMENSVYFHPGTEFAILAELFRKHSSENTWDVLVSIIQAGLAMDDSEDEEA